MPGPDPNILLGIRPQPPVNIGQIAEQADQIQSQQTNQQINALKMQQAQAALQGQAKANQIVAGLPRNEDNTFDTGTLAQRLAAANVPLDAQEKLITSADGLNKFIQSVNADKVEQGARLSNFLLNQHKAGEPITADTVHLGIAIAHDLGIGDDKTAAKLTQAIGEGGDPETILKSIRSLGKEWSDTKPVVLPEGSSLVSPQGQTIVKGTPKPKTRAELAADAADPQSPTAAQSKAALELDAPKASGFQHASMLVDGKPSEVLVNPDPSAPNKVFDLNGQPIANAAARVRPIPPQQTGNATTEADNAKIVAKGIIDGDTAPSILEGTRGTAQGMALMAEIKKQGGDSAQILNNWIGTKKAIGALNSTSQLRLAETINKASASLNQLDQLNQQWSDNASRWGIKALNRASLTAAQNGAYGPQAASVAQRLDAQIADVTSELGQGIMGGNSPTDHALSLAGKNLSSNWTQEVLSDAIKQVRYNLNLAQSARNDILQGLGNTSTQVQTPAPAAAPPVKRWNLVNGQLVPE